MLLVEEAGCVLSAAVEERLAYKSELETNKYSPPRPKPQKFLDLAFLSRSLLLPSSDGVSLAPNLYPAGIGIPLTGPEILTLFDASGAAKEVGSGEGARSAGAACDVGNVGEDCTVDNDECTKPLVFALSGRWLPDPRGSG